MATYLVTGASGAIGSALIPLLLQDPEAQIRLLLRSEAKMELLKKFWGVGSEVDHRLKAISGDVEKMGLGLSTEDYNLLIAECTHLIHSAGNVRMNLPLDEARSAAVSSAKQLVNFAEVCPRLEKLEFISTVGVAGKTPGTIPETPLTEQPGFHNTYEQAKAEAEAILLQKIARGLPATLHRPSMVVGNSKTGKILHFQIFYHLCQFLTGKRSGGLLPAFGDTALDIIPADYVAQAILWSSKTKETIGQILHLCSGPEDAIPLYKLKEAVDAFFISKGEKIPRAVFVPLFFLKIALPLVSAFTTPQNKRALQALPMFLAYLEEKQVFDNTQTKKLLTQHGIIVPPVKQYLQPVLEYYFNTKANFLLKPDASHANTQSSE